MPEENVVPIAGIVPTPPPPKPYGGINLACAMAAFTSTVEAAQKTERNDFKDYAYANLFELERVAKTCVAHGLGYFFEPKLSAHPGQAVCKLWIIHLDSGEYTSGELPVLLGEGKNANQEMGAGLTYAKKSLLRSMFSLPEQDDDAQSLERRPKTKAVQAPARPATPKTPPRPVPQPVANAPKQADADPERPLLPAEIAGFRQLIQQHAQPQAVIANFLKLVDPSASKLVKDHLLKQWQADLLIQALNADHGIQKTA